MQMNYSFSASLVLWSDSFSYVYDLMLDQPWSLNISCAIGPGGVGTANGNSTVTLTAVDVNGTPVQPLNPKTTILTGPTVLNVRAYDARN
jgi:hypothetical protein